MRFTARPEVEFMASGEVDRERGALGAAERRLEGVRKLLAEAHARMALQFGFRLWDGSLVPTDWPRDALAIAIADEGVVAALLRAPRVTTLANLWAARRLDIVNGGIFDLMEKRPKVRPRELTRSSARRARCSQPLRSCSRRAASLGRWRRSKPTARATDRRLGTRRTSPTTMTSRTRSTRCFSIPRWSTLAGTSMTGATTSRRRTCRSST
jgi:hypothetical protein